MHKHFQNDLCQPAQRLYYSQLSRQFLCRLLIRFPQRDFNKSANGYMQRGNMPIEAFEALRSSVDTWLSKDYPSKNGGQVNSAKCFDFYSSEDLAKLFTKYNPCASKASWLDKEEYEKQCRVK